MGPHGFSRPVLVLFAILSMTTFAAADHMVWFNPAGAKITGFAALVPGSTPQAVRIQHSGGPGPQSGTVTIPLAVLADGEIDSLVLCYKTVLQDSPSRITGITFRSMSLPTATTTLYSDVTVRHSESGECLALDIADAPPAGAPDLALSYIVEPVTHLEIGAIGIKMKTATLVGLRGPFDRPEPALALGPSSPNPFGRSTRITYRLSEPGHVRLIVYDLAGRVVRTLVDRNAAAGEHDAWWDGRDESGAALSSGVYFWRLATDDSWRSERLVLLR